MKDKEKIKVNFEAKKFSKRNNLPPRINNKNKQES
jgi:hypothetical protein